MRLGPKFRDVIPGYDEKASMALLDSFQWNLSMQNSNGKWQLFTGNVLLLESDDKAEVASFLVGMALTLAILPPEIQARIRTLLP